MSKRPPWWLLTLPMRPDYSKLGTRDMLLLGQYLKDEYSPPGWDPSRIEGLDVVWKLGKPIPTDFGVVLPLHLWAHVQKVNRCA